MTKDLESLKRDLELTQAEYERKGRPLLDKIVSISTQIADIKRERGELFYVDYMRYHQPHTEECDDLEEAKAYATSLADMGDGYVTGIRGPGVALGEREWDVP